MLGVDAHPRGVDVQPDAGNDGIHKRDSIRLSAKEVNLGQPVRYGSPAHSPAHPGFKSAQSKIAKREGISKDRAGAILAASSRGASKAAKKDNSRLRRVKG